MVLAHYVTFMYAVAIKKEGIRHLGDVRTSAKRNNVIGNNIYIFAE